MKCNKENSHVKHKDGTKGNGVIEWINSLNDIDYYFHYSAVATVSTTALNKNSQGNTLKLNVMPYLMVLAQRNPQETPRYINIFINDVRHLSHLGKFSYLFQIRRFLWVLIIIWFVQTFLTWFGVCLWNFKDNYELEIHVKQPYIMYWNPIKKKISFFHAIFLRVYFSLVLKWTLWTCQIFVVFRPLTYQSDHP